MGRLFPGAVAVLRALQTDAQFARTEIAVASSTTEPSYANTCLDQLVIDADGPTVGSLVKYREIYPSNKGRVHFPALQKASGVPYHEMLFFDDCTYSDNCGVVACCCPGVVCVRTPAGLTEDLFRHGLEAF